MIKKPFLFFTLMILTYLFKFGGYSKRKEFAPKESKFFPIRVALSAEVDGLRLSHENVHPFPS